MVLDEPGLLAIAVIAFLNFVRWIWRRRFIAAERAWRPQELQDAEIVYAEQVFRASRPVSIIAKLDRGYRHRSGLITLVELKTRRIDRVYLSDVIELSAQRFALEAQTKEPVAPYGYVLVQSESSRQKKPHQVQLLTHAEVIALVKRREAILAGLSEARYTRWPDLCRRCGFREQCRPPWAFEQDE